MRMRDFIKENRQELDDCIKRINPNGPRLNDADREEWINNDERLYIWARAEGVKV